jgi:hypothetical protein
VSQDHGVPASPSGHSDEPASSLAADAGSVPNADPYSAEAWASESYEKRMQLAATFIATAKDSFEHARKLMALGMALMDGVLTETDE